MGYCVARPVQRREWGRTLGLSIEEVQARHRTSQIEEERGLRLKKYWPTLRSMLET